MGIGTQKKRPNAHSEQRRKRKLSLRALADATGLAVSFICDIENGKRAPSDESAALLAKAMGCSRTQYRRLTDDAQSITHAGKAPSRGR